MLIGTAAMLLSGWLSYGAETGTGVNATNRVGETLVPLKSGEARLVSYGLYCVTSNSRAGSNAPSGGDLVLILRNTGGKFINLERVSAGDFTLRDAQGRDIKLYLRSRPTGMHHDAAEVIHLWEDHPAGAVEPWSLRFETFKAGLPDPVSLTITGIEPSKAPRK